MKSQYISGEYHDPDETLTAAAKRFREGKQGGERVVADGDHWTCPCGNTTMSSGFFPCLASGEQVEPTVGGPWGGELYACADCGRVVNQRTLAVAEKKKGDGR